MLKPRGRIACQLMIRGPAEDDELRSFLKIAGFAPIKINNCTDAWLDCMLDSIECLSAVDARRKSWKEDYDEAVERSDRAYRFVAERSMAPTA